MERQDEALWQTNKHPLRNTATRVGIATSFEASTPSLLKLAVPHFLSND